MNPLHFIQSLFHHQQAQQHPQPQPAPHQNTYTQAQMQQMIPVGQPIPQAFMDSYSPHTRMLAQIYQHNPADPRVMHLDPKMFGYAPDNIAMHPAISAMLLHSLNRPGLQMPANLPIGGFHNAINAQSAHLGINPGGFSYDPFQEQLPINTSNFRDTQIGL